MKEYEFFLASSLEKVFPENRPEELKSNTLTAFQGEKVAFQLVYITKDNEEYAPLQEFDLKFQGELKEYIRVRKVELVPSDFPAYGRCDTDYITTQPGMFPDLLYPMKPGETVHPITNQYRSIWLDVTIPSNQHSGNYEVKITLSLRSEIRNMNGLVTNNPDAPYEVNLLVCIRVIDCQLPKQEIPHVEWFHCDGLAAYYNESVFSERHWEVMTNFIAAASREYRINTLLTPVFTPPIDTAVGHERKTVQLVDVIVTKGVYSFDFKKLERWCRICKENQITYLEIPHFFTQCGAYATPNIMALVDGEYQRIFGWEVASDDPKYRHFLEKFIPALREKLKEFGYDDVHTFYHISDEPSTEHLKTYQKAREQVLDLLEGTTIIDALSDVAFYQEGLIEHPIPSEDHYHKFKEHKIKNLWTYYCCGQCSEVPNRLFAQPSYRNRILGVLMYVQEVKGFLHWGFNFYNTGGSREHINPYVVTHAGYSFPSGDSFLVYPSEEGTAYSSIRGEVLYDAFIDYAALCYLESLTSREEVLKLILCDRTEAFTFFEYPKEADYLLNLRQRVCEHIERVKRS